VREDFPLQVVLTLAVFGLFIRELAGLISPIGLPSLYTLARNPLNRRGDPTSSGNIPTAIKLIMFRTCSI